MLKVRGLTKKFGKQVVNRDISLDCKEGEISILLGPNGAGKSTAIKCILGLLRHEGEITIGGFPAKTEEAKRLFGYVPEYPCLYDMLTVREQFEFVVRAYKLDREKSRRYAAELVDRLRLTEVVDTLCKDLSKGMQQKVSIICALLPRPKLLLLDEHTAALDPNTAAKILEISCQIIEDNKMTSLMITHNMRDAIRCGNRLILMHQGRIILDIRGEEKAHLTKQELLDRFAATAGEQEETDAVLLS